MCPTTERIHIIITIIIIIIIIIILLFFCIHVVKLQLILINNTIENPAD